MPGRPAFPKEPTPKYAHTSSVLESHNLDKGISEPFPPFDPQLCVCLAAFAFAAYGDPTGCKWQKSHDGTDIGKAGSTTTTTTT